MNKKGFSTIELIVSFVIVSFVAIAIFRTVVVLMDKVNFYQSESEMTIINGNIINSIQKDLRYRKFYGISACGTDCYDITYQDLAVRRLKVDSANNSIQYGGFTDKLPSDVKITGALQLATQTLTIAEGKNNTILKIFIPIANEVMNVSHSINIIYQYDNRDIGGLPPYSG